MRYLIYLVIIIGLPYLIERYLKRKTLPDSTKGSAILSTFIAALVFCILFNIWGTYTYGDHIGNFFEKRNYDSRYFVYVSENPESSKHYRLEADIRRGEGNYYLLKIYWPNGGMMSFEDDPPSLNVNSGSYFYDEKDKEWRVELTAHRITNNN